MKKFIAYFDFLGFKDFILNNDIEYQRRIMGEIYLNIEDAVGKGKYIDYGFKFTPDRRKTNINCLNFSDTVVFWSNDDSIKALEEIIKVVDRFNYKSIVFSFPVRGALLYGEIEHKGFNDKNKKGSIYNINSVYGKGVVDAYIKAETQNWAGTVIDESIIQFLSENNYDVEKFLEHYTKRYNAPYKYCKEEYVLRLAEGQLPEEAFINLSDLIRKNFSAHKKDITNSRVQEKLHNTLKYLESFKKQ